jgi:ribose 5-phosphate isomerase A
VTDSGNRILDASFGRIPDPEELAVRLASIPGVVEHGLFLGFADLALVASPDGLAEIEA